MHDFVDLNANMKSNELPPAGQQVINHLNIS